MKIKKRHVYAIFGLLILIIGIFIINAAVDVDKTKAWHSSGDIKIKVDGSEMTLQNAISQDLFNGTHNYRAPSSISNPGHNASEIWVAVNGSGTRVATEKTLLSALNSTSNGLCNNLTTVSYSSHPTTLSYHFATDINVTIKGVEMSLQNAIDTGKFCFHIYTYSWYNSSWSTCTAPCYGAHTRTVYCIRDDGLQVADSYCSGTKPATSEQCNICRWVNEHLSHNTYGCPYHPTSCPSGACYSPGAVVHLCGTGQTCTAECGGGMHCAGYEPYDSRCTVF